MPSLARLLVLPLFAVLTPIIVPAAVAAESGPAVAVDAARWSLDVPAARRGDCRSSTRRQAVVTRSYRPPVAGVLQARLRAPHGSDWDLAVVDAASGRTLGASLGFGAREVVSVPLAAADRVVLRVCRRSGAGARAHLAVTHAALPEVRAARKLSLVEVPIRSPRDQERLIGLGFDTADHSDGRTLKIVLHGQEQAADLVRAGFQYRILVADLAAQDRRDRAAERRSELSGARSPLPSGRTTYRTLADHQADLKALAEQHPDRVRGFVLPGTSLEGREISGVEIAANVRRTDDGRPHVYVDGVNHAREWPAGEIPAEFAIDLVKNPAADPRLTGILDGARTFVVPIVNVDGFDASRTAGSGVMETANVGDLPWAANGAGVAYKRKNCRWADQAQQPPVPCLVAHLANDMGVDTNRNYGFGWGGPGASTTWAQMTYRGAAAFSEPETTALRRFMFTIQPAMVVSNHTVAALMLRPPGQQETPDTPDEAPMKALGDAMGDQTGYRSERSWELYDTTGTTIDWTYGALAAWSYTPELGGRGFHGPHPEHVVEQYQGNGERGGMRAALILAAQAAIRPESHAVIAGRAPAGRTLRVTRTFVTRTWGGEALEPDVHSSSITVGESGRFEWAVTPSRRPYEQAGSWTLTCERDGAVLETREVAVERGQRATVDLACGGQAPHVQPPTAACSSALRSIRVRTRGGALEVLYRRARRGRVTVALVRGSRRMLSGRGSARGAVLKRAGRLRSGRYTLRITHAAASGVREVHTIAITKQGARIRAGKVRGGCR